MLDSIPIIHLHGDLRPLPTPGHESPKSRMYAKDSNPQMIKRASKSIRVVHEDIADLLQFQEAHRLLHAAKLVCFLGFGYDDTNLHRLQLENYGHAAMFGTCYGKTEAECAVLFAKYPLLKLADNTFDCLGFLRGNAYVNATLSGVDHSKVTKENKSRESLTKLTGRTWNLRTGGINEHFSRARRDSNV